MQALVSQTLLPLVLAFIMLGMGLSLRLVDFRALLARPGVFILGLSLQMLCLPILALLIIALLPLPPFHAAGLFLLSLCPGGATSNLFSYLARGNTALSLSLTAVSSMISVFSLPLFFIGYLQLYPFINESDLAYFSLPVFDIVKQLAAVTLMPVAIGMAIRHFYPQWAQRWQNQVKHLAAAGMLFVVTALAVMHPEILRTIMSTMTASVLLLASTAIALTYALTKHRHLAEQDQRTLAIEVGIQNASMAMMVALSILHRPELAITPLNYGLFMNVPALAFIYFLQRQDHKAAQSTLLKTHRDHQHYAKRT